MKPLARVPASPTRLALVPAAATAVVYFPHLVTDAGQTASVPPPLAWMWLALLLVTAPAIAWVLNSHDPRVAIGPRQVLLVGMPQLIVAVVMVRLDVWLEVRSGYLLAGSGEEAMAYGIGTVLGVIGGSVLAILVALSARVGH